jgi:hypothetical protein
MSDIGSFASTKDNYWQSYSYEDMKTIEIDEKVERHLSTNEKRNDKQSNFLTNVLVLFLLKNYGYKLTFPNGYCKYGGGV